MPQLTIHVALNDAHLVEQARALGQPLSHTVGQALRQLLDGEPLHERKPLHHDREETAGPPDAAAIDGEKDVVAGREGAGKAGGRVQAHGGAAEPHSRAGPGGVPDDGGGVHQGIGGGQCGT